MAENQNNNKTTQVVSVKQMLNEDGAVDYVTEGNVEVTLTMDILKKMVKASGNAPPPNDGELLMFAYTCVTQGLNPYLQECWLAWLGEQQGWTPLVAAQSRVRKAQSQPDYNGYQWGWIDKEGVRHKAGAESTLSNPEDIIGVWGAIHRKDWKIPFYHEVFKTEYQKLSKSGYGSWDQRPLTMLLKVIRDQTHKFAYADKMGNLMTENEARYVQNGTTSDEPARTAALLEEPPEKESPQAEKQPPEKETNKKRKKVDAKTTDAEEPNEEPETEPPAYRCMQCDGQFTDGQVGNDKKECPTCRGSLMKVAEEKTQ